MSDLLSHLNQAQRDAVCHGQGPLLVLAGAGSGKTRVLTYRIARLLQAGVAHGGDITAVTFTNKAAREMQTRVEQLAGPEQLRGCFVGTFHRWALELLRRFPDRVGLRPGFTILDADDQRGLITRALKELGHDPKAFPPRMIQASMSAKINAGTDIDAHLPGGVAGSPEHVLHEVWSRYQELKGEAGAVDFDDMLLHAHRLLHDHEKVRQLVQSRARFLLVDEFQDTNPLQVKLLKQALDEELNITAVGDEDQSIYRWRGAEMENILSFERHFPAAQVVKLEQNYRSTQPILAAAGQLIAHNVKRRGKRLTAVNSEGGEPVRLMVRDDERQEAQWVVDQISGLRLQHELSCVAVLFRTNAQTRPFEEELTRRRLAYRVVGGLRFWQRAEVKDALAYLRLVLSDDDMLAFLRVVNVPARGIGKGTLDVLRHHAAATGLGLTAAARDLPSVLTPRATKALTVFFGLIDEARRQRTQLEPGELLRWLLRASGILASYEGDSVDYIARRENLDQLVAALTEAGAHGQDLEQFLDAVALLEETDEVSPTDAVSLMTLHAAKGLEFDVVFLAGVEDGLLPHSSSFGNDDALEEERRLAYVGMTRARQWLALTAARSRFLFGNRQRTNPSRFLAEIGGEVMQDVSELPVTFLSAPTSTESPSHPGATSQANRASAASPRRRSRSTIRPTVTDANGTGWRPGERVRHKRFGTGLILSCKGSGPQLKLVVYFDGAGSKTLVPTIARLEKV